MYELERRGKPDKGKARVVEKRKGKGKQRVGDSDEALDALCI